MMTSKDVFIVPDCHGNIGLVQSLLEDQGILDSEGNRSTEVYVVQLGDLTNCVLESIEDDLDALDKGQKWFDRVLVGNHEHPYFGGPTFTGFHPDSVIRNVLGYMKNVGQLKAAFCSHEILVTHAGVHPDYHFDGYSASVMEDEINAAWDHDPTLPVFSDIGRMRGGFQVSGGVLWSHHGAESRAPFDQIYGHTIQDQVIFDSTRPFSLCLDLGAGKGRTKIAGAWIRHLTGEVEVVVHDDKRVFA